MEEKRVEQIAHDHAMKAEAGQQETAKYSFIAGYTTAQQSQPMWREIEPDKEYRRILAKGEEKMPESIMICDGKYLIECGHTHYVTTEDLLRLSVEKK